MYKKAETEESSNVRNPMLPEDCSNVHDPPNSSKKPEVPTILWAQGLACFIKIANPFNDAFKKAGKR